MGLRDEKRQRLRRSIIENAVALFRERGFEQVTVREIARLCDVSEATFFNHFATKDAVLSCWASAELERAFSEAATEARTLRQALRDVATRLAAGVDREPGFAAVAWGRARLTHLDAPPRAIPLIEAAQQGGELRRDVEARELARLLAAVAATTISSELGRAGDPPPEDGLLAARLRQALDLLLDGSRRRHERVRPADAATGRAAAPRPSPDP